MATVAPITDDNLYADKEAPTPTPSGEEHLRIRAADLNAIKAQLAAHATAINTNSTPAGIGAASLSELTDVEAKADEALAAAGGIASIVLANDEDYTLHADSAGKLLLMQMAGTDRDVILAVSSMSGGHTFRVMRTHPYGPGPGPAADPGGDVLFVGDVDVVIFGPDRIEGAYSEVRVTYLGNDGTHRFFKITPEDNP